MHSNGTRAWAIVVTAIAALVQLAVWWLLFDDSTFGPDGPGSRVIQDMFGKNASPGGVAWVLGNIVQLAVLIVLAILAAGMGTPQPLPRASRLWSEPRKRSRNDRRD